MRALWRYCLAPLFVATAILSASAPAFSATAPAATHFCPSGTHWDNITNTCQ